MKYFSIPLLLVAFASMLYMSVGQIMVSGIEINNAKEQATSLLSSSELAELTITAEDLLSGKAKMIGSHEIRYDGKLYDIASQTQAGNKTMLQVKWDEKEEGLIGELCEHVENLLEQLPAHGKSTKHVLKNFGKDYFSCQYKLALSIAYDEGTMPVAIHLNRPASVPMAIQSPPPQA